MTDTGLADTAHARTRVPRLAVGVAAALCGAVLLVSSGWNTRAAGGSDSYCYLHQAEAWLNGTVRAADPIAAAAPWPDAPLTFAPMGHVPSPVVRGAIVPVCPAGLSLTMAAAELVAGRTGAWMVVPVLAVLAVWSVFNLGRAAGGAAAGVSAALLVACSPVFLYQSVQPMSDVPALAWWMLAGWMALMASRRSAAIAAAATGLGILTRPQLAPLLLPVLLVAWCRGEGPGNACRARVARAAIIVAGAAIGVVAVCAIQRYMYGSWFRSGYGDPAALFAWSHVGPNAVHYAGWLVRTETPVVLLGLVAPLVMRRRTLGWSLLLFVPLTAAIYLPYVVFDAWWYLRFLLPAIAVLLVLSMAAVTALVARAPRAGRWVAVAVVLAAAGWMGGQARAGHVFELASLERRFIDVGTYGTTLPPRAVVVTVSHSGSIRYHGGRQTLSWDSLDPQWLDRAVAWLEANGHPVFLLLEPSEERDFRARFSPVNRLGALDWPPSAQIGTAALVYRASDRAKYFAGGNVNTAVVVTHGPRRR